MARVLFFEKPGCINNTRQKALLAAAGHEVEARDLLREPWRPEILRPYFGGLPVVDWFNPTAPRLRSGEIRPEGLDEAGALAAMIDDPLLIRRPLMQVAGECRVGFDPSAVHAWIGLASQPDRDLDRDMESCPRTTGHDCSEEEG